MDQDNFDIRVDRKLSDRDNFFKQVQQCCACTFGPRHGSDDASISRSGPSRGKSVQRADQRGEYARMLGNHQKNRARHYRTRQPPQ